MTAEMAVGPWGRLRRKRAALYWRLASLVRALAANNSARALDCTAQQINADIVLYTLGGEQLASAGAPPDLGPTMRTLLPNVRSLTIVDDVTDAQDALARAMRKHRIAAIFPFYRAAERETGADPTGWIMICGAYEEYLYTNDDITLLEGIIAHSFDTLLEHSAIGPRPSAQTAPLAAADHGAAALPGRTAAVYLGRDRAMMEVLRQYFPALKHYVAPVSRGFLSHPPPAVVFYDRRAAGREDDKVLQEHSLALSRDRIVCMVFGSHQGPFRPDAALTHVEFVVYPDSPDAAEIARHARRIIAPGAPVETEVPTLQQQMDSRERALLAQYLVLSGNNKPQAAALAGLTLPSLLRKLKKHGIK